ncbi:MAG: (2Fe-2S)-binding protein [Phycisphaerae bacterium]|nr:(2Fe-2S)-binding protein [Phycisphaerae bacterium]
MPKLTINGRECEFKPGEMILQAANRASVAVPQYCYHDGLSIVASCRICLAEVWAPNPRNNNALEPLMGGKLLPTCQTAAAEGMVVYTDSPKSIANQKAVMEYLLINHPLDCPVCDQAGECFLQDYSYEYGRGASRFEEQKVKQPKKDLGPHVYLYADRCIMCSRCVRFTREVSGTAELCVSGRGNKEEIDVFPGRALDNELSANVVDLCPVGALLEKDFLFAQRVWFLKSTPSIDGITASGDNILVEHNEGKVYRVKPRTNMAVNRWWISDEVRFGWKHVHSDDRLGEPRRRQFGTPVGTEWGRALREAAEGLKKVVAGGGRLLLMVSPMLSCEDAFALAAAARALDPRAGAAVGPIPTRGQDRVYPVGSAPDAPNAFRVYAEKAPNARGVRRVLEAVLGAGSGGVLTYAQAVARLGKGGGSSDIGGVIVTGNYTTGGWAGKELLDALAGKFVVAIDTLAGPISDGADVLLPGAPWVEKSGSFENARGMVQAFEQAIPPREGARAEAQIGTDLVHAAGGDAALAAAGLCTHFNAANARSAMATRHPGELSVFATGVCAASVPVEQTADMQVVEL